MTKDNKTFIEDLLKNLDDDHEKVEEEEEEAKEEVDEVNGGDTFIDYEDDCSVFVERKLPSAAHSQKAIQIIKENSEILDKILRKKGERVSSLGPLRSNSVSVASSSLLSEEHEENNRKRSLGNGGKSRSVEGSNHHGVPPPAMILGNTSTKPITFNPFPKPVMRRRKEVGKKLGLY